MSITERMLVSPLQAGTDATVSHSVIYPFSSPGYISAAYLEPDTAITANDTNYMTFSVSANSTTIASRATTTAGGNVVADTPESMTMASGVRDKAELSQGEVITVAATKSGTGPAYSGRIVIVVTLDRHA